MATSKAEARSLVASNNCLIDPVGLDATPLIGEYQSPAVPDLGARFSRQLEDVPALAHLFPDEGVA